MANADQSTVAGFGREWAQFDQTELSDAELAAYYDSYFRIFPWESLPSDAVGFDLGCGSGRWANFVAPRVAKLHCIDASDEALDVARRSIRAGNCDFHLATVDSMPLPDGSMDFGYSLGVLHHVPDTAGAIRSCVDKLKPGAPLLLYLYYAFDGRPLWFRSLWRASDIGRQAVSRLPWSFKRRMTDAIALGVYWPLAKAALAAEKLGASVEQFPLSFYRRSSIYTMRTDALDRFGTRLEQRFTKVDIQRMMASAGLESIRFSDDGPYWCAIGHKRR